MSTILKRLILVFVLCVSVSACNGIPIGHGLKMYPLGLPQQVIIDLNNNQYGELWVDGHFFQTLTSGGGSTSVIPLPWDLLSNRTVVFKAYRIEQNGAKVFLGQSYRQFNPESYSNRNQYWRVDYFDPVVRQNVR